MAKKADSTNALDAEIAALMKTARSLDLDERLAVVDRALKWEAIKLKMDDNDSIDAFGDGKI